MEHMTRICELPGDRFVFRCDGQTATDWQVFLIRIDEPSLINGAGRDEATYAEITDSQDIRINRQRQA